MSSSPYTPQRSIGPPQRPSVWFYLVLLACRFYFSVDSSSPRQWCATSPEGSTLALVEWYCFRLFSECDQSSVISSALSPYISLSGQLNATDFHCGSLSAKGCRMLRSQRFVFCWRHWIRVSTSGSCTLYSRTEFTLELNIFSLVCVE